DVRVDRELLLGGPSVHRHRAAALHHRARMDLEGPGKGFGAGEQALLQADEREAAAALLGGTQLGVAGELVGELQLEGGGVADGAARSVLLPLVFGVVANFATGPLSLRGGLRAPPPRYAWVP